MAELIAIAAKSKGKVKKVLPAPHDNVIADLAPSVTGPCQ
jgi:hypothetical protein